MDCKAHGHSPIKILMTVVERGKGDRIAEIMRNCKVAMNMVVLGTGTAKADIRGILGLESLEKDIILSLAPSAAIGGTFEALRHKMYIDKPGHGIAVTMPLSAISTAAAVEAEAEMGCDHVNENEAEKDTKNGREESKMSSREYELILAVADRKCSEAIVQAARDAGAKGGTVVHGRNLSAGEVKKFMSITLSQEKDLVFIVVSHKIKNTVMVAMSREIYKITGEHGKVMAIPIDDAIGLYTNPAEEEADKW